MELRKFSDELLLKMKMEIERLTFEEPNTLRRSLQVISMIENYLRELKQAVLKCSFKNQQEEIDFFRKVKPTMMSQLLYNKKLFHIHLFESHNDSDSRIKYYQRHLKSLQAFISKNAEFYRYVFSGDLQFDKEYFTRSPSSVKSFDLDERFSTTHDGKLAKILANELLKEYLTGAIKKHRLGSTNENDARALIWTGSKTDLIELIYGLHASGVFNKASADLKQIATCFEKVFDVNLGNYYRTFQEIRIRKGGQTNFLDHLKEKLLGKIQELES